MKKLKDMSFINRNITALARKRYEETEKAAHDRLKEYPDNYGALYILALTAYYKKNLDLSYSYFMKLLKYHKLDRKSQKWFIRQLLSYPLYKQKQNEIVKDRCKELIPLIQSKKIKIEIFKHLCVALHGLNQAQETLEVCLELRHMGFVDKDLEQIEKIAKRALN